VLTVAVRLAVLVVLAAAVLVVIPLDQSGKTARLVLKTEAVAAVVVVTARLG
jgi:hypothetical protein